MQVILTLPFLIELFGDWWLIKHGRKDIPTWFRAVMTAVFIAVAGMVGHASIIGYLKSSIIALLPYCFFDPALNLLRGLMLLYEGKTKKYDKILAKFDSGAILVGRVVLFVILIAIYNAL